MTQSTTMVIMIAMAKERGAEQPCKILVDLASGGGRSCHLDPVLLLLLLNKQFSMCLDSVCIHDKITLGEVYQKLVNS